jgi:hypothetical protein
MNRTHLRAARTLAACALTCALTCALGAALPAPAASLAADPQEPARDGKPVPPPVTLEAVRTEPTRPGAGLWRLAVEVRNAGSRPASAFAFRVRIGGRELPVYRDQVFLQAVAPGAKETIPLYNFWLEETGRPAPGGGRLEVEVTLREAGWIEVEKRDGAEVWKPAGPVEGLPVEKTAVLSLPKPPKKP